MPPVPPNVPGRSIFTPQLEPKIDRTDWEQIVKFLRAFARGERPTHMTESIANDLANKIQEIENVREIRCASQKLDELATVLESKGLVKLAIEIDRISNSLDKQATCQNCKRKFNYGKEPEVAMGAVKCPHCGKVVNQYGQSSK